MPDTETERYEAWHGMARESFEAAVGLERGGYIRPALSRFYYAAYQAITAALLYRGVTPPTVGGVPREAWSHDDTPDVYVTQIEKVIPSVAKRVDAAKRLRELYGLRVDADYVSRAEVTDEQARQARRHAGYILKFVSAMLPSRED